MAKNNAYALGYNKGYIEGMKAKSKAKEFLAKDLEYIYGGMCVAMGRRGYKEETIMRFISQIQDIWNDCIEKDISMRDLCLEETGIDIQQTMEEGA